MVVVRQNNPYKRRRRFKTTTTVLLSAFLLTVVLGMLAVTLLLPSFEKAPVALDPATVVEAKVNLQAPPTRKLDIHANAENESMVKAEADADAEDVEMLLYSGDPYVFSSVKQEILRQAQPVALAYVDASDGVSHLGALDVDGQPGYRHDETALRNHPPAFQLPPSLQRCGNRDANFRMLTEKVRVDLEAHRRADELVGTLDGNGNANARVKIFCTVYTIAKNHDRIQPIRETWGQKCDGFMVASDKTDPSINAVAIPHEGPEEYNNIYQKVRSIWSYVYDNYYQDYDWFHIGGDDLYILVENLRLYLESNEIREAARFELDSDDPRERPLFLGRRFKEQGNEKRIFNSGGSGYTINRAALKGLVAQAFPKCFPHRKTFAEDVMVAQCFRDHLGVYPYDTKDPHGGERYMPFVPAHHLNYRLPAHPERSTDWYVKYSIDIKEGLDHCAADSVAFHYVKSDLMVRMHAILYRYCER